MMIGYDIDDDKPEILSMVFLQVAPISVVLSTRDPCERIVIVFLVCVFWTSYRNALVTLSNLQVCLLMLLVVHSLHLRCWEASL